MNAEVAENRNVTTGELMQPTVFMIAPGSFFSPATMEPLAGYPRASGYTAEIINDFPIGDENATPGDYVNTLTRRLRTHHTLGRRVVLLAWSGGSAHVGEALRRMEEEDGSHPVDLVVSISGTLGELPPKDEGDITALRQPRNSERFRDGIKRRPGDRMVEFDPEKALDVFFNRGTAIGAIMLREGVMGPQHRVAASPMPKQLNTHWLYLHPEDDNVRNLPFVLEAVDQYKYDPFRMYWRIIKNEDHSVPITNPGVVWAATINHLLRHEIKIESSNPARARGVAPMPRQPAHDQTAVTAQLPV